MRTFYFRVLLSLLACAVPLTLGACSSDDSPSSPPETGSEAGVDAAKESSVVDAPKDNVMEVHADSPPFETSTESGDGPAPDGEIDSDGDGVPDDQDICPGYDDHIDSDGDGVPDGCDLCPGFDDSIDTTGSGVPDCRTMMKLWLRADRGVFTDDGSGGVGQEAKDEEVIRLWKDQGIWSGHGEQTDPNRQPMYVASAFANGAPAIRFAGTEGSSGESSANVDSLDGPFLISSHAAKTLFLVSRRASGVVQVADVSMLELNRTGSGGGSRFRVTPEIGVHINNGNALFSRHPLDDHFHIIAVQNPTNSTTSAIRAWYDGIPIDASSILSRAVDTGSGGYRIGDGHTLGAAGFVGEIAEVLVYEHALSADQHERVGLTLERKYGLKTWYTDKKEPISVYLMAGQSNMVGQGLAEELTEPLKAVQGDVMAWWSTTTKWSPLRWGAGNGTTQFGPELSFGRKISDQKPNARIALFKYAVNGTNLANDWNPVSGFTYSIFKKSMNAARDRLEALGIDYTIRGFLWMQGESDAMDPQMATDYVGNMTEFIAAVRQATGVPELPVAIARIRGTMPSPFDYALQVRLAQETVAANDPHVRIVDTDSLSFHADEIHYDTAGQLKLGENFADVILNLSPP